MTIYHKDIMCNIALLIMLAFGRLVVVLLFLDYFKDLKSRRWILRVLGEGCCFIAFSLCCSSIDSNNKMKA